MTRQKTFKSRIRTRMDKTGESYTTARRQLLSRAAPPEPAVVSTPPVREPAAAPAPVGRTHSRAQRDRTPDPLLRERTGRGWDEWIALLETWGAVARTHTETARWLVDAHEVSTWWAQTITVGYEQARGLRSPGQSRDGGWQAAASRTVAVPVDRLYAAFVDEDLRRRWLPDLSVRVRTATPPKRLRADWDGGPSRLVVGFVAAGPAKARVDVVHEKLADAEETGRLKLWWRDRLTGLKTLLESAEAGR